jgi:signal transduction histidine kinase
MGMDRPNCKTAVDLDDVRRTERRRLDGGAAGLALAALELLAEGAAADPAGLAAASATKVRASLGERDEPASPPPGSIAAALEEERAWMRCQLHDGALQVLEYVAGDGFGTGLADTEVRALARHAADELRWALAPAATGEQRDLLSELRACVGAVQRRSSATLELEGDASVPPASRATTAALVGAVREALTNAAKHAGADRVVVRLARRTDELEVTVADDGVGADPARLRGGFGIARSIHDRLARRGGRACIESRPGDGTLVRLSVPAADQGRDAA